jgi:hypothetical protein
MEVFLHFGCVHCTVLGGLFGQKEMLAQKCVKFAEAAVLLAFADWP